MPTLPSGLSLALWDEAIFEPGQNWFKCPEGHFWYHTAAPEMGEPLFDKDEQVWTLPVHAIAPRNRDEVKQFIQILEMAEDGSGVWRGEWLGDFPKYRTLTDADKIAWDAWFKRPEVDAYLDRVIARCSELAVMSKTAQGYAVFRDRP